MERLTRWNEQTEQAELVDYDQDEWKSFKNTLCVNDDIAVSTATNKLAEYEDAEEQGLLVKLPVAVGDVVYWAEKEVYPFAVKNIQIDRFGINVRLSYCGTEENKQYWEVGTSIDNLNERFFLTSEEAEKALERMV